MKNELQTDWLHIYMYIDCMCFFRVNEHIRYYIVEHKNKACYADGIYELYWFIEMYDLFIFHEP